MSAEIPSDIPKTPRAIGISKQLFVSIVCIVLFVVIVFLIMLDRYSPKQNKPVDTTNQLSSRAINTDKTSVANMIKTLQQQDASPIIAHGNPELKNNTNKTTPDSALADSSTMMNDNFLKEASSSSLSVFQKAEGSSDSSAGQATESSGSQAAMAGSQSGLSKYASQNMQSQKQTFLERNKANTQAILPSRIVRARSPYEAQAGTIIPATLLTGINSDLPGQIIASVRSNVYDSVTGNFLLIPQGTKVVGTYDSKVSYGQSRALIAWSRLVFPDGSSFNLQGMPGADLMGYGGLKDQVNNHYFKIFGSALMFSVFGAAAQLSQPQTSNNNQLSPQQIIAASIGQQVTQTGMQMIAKDMNIQPTINIRPGDLFNILITRDMVFPSPYGHA